MLRPSQIRQMLKETPFVPLRVCLSDGRSVVIRHPDQAVVSESMLFVGVTKVERSKPSLSPRSSEEIAKDWVLVNLLHVATVEPVNGRVRPRPRKSKH